MLQSNVTCKTISYNKKCFRVELRAQLAQLTGGDLMKCTVINTARQLFAFGDSNELICICLAQRGSLNIFPHEQSQPPIPTPHARYDHGQPV